MKITNDIKYVGVNDRKTDLFEGQYKIPNGISYNSYVLIDEKCAVFDTVDQGFADEWLNNISSALKNKAPDYLIVQHMEPDHSANIHIFMEKYKNAQIVASEKAFSMMRQFFGTEYEERRIVAEEGDTLCTGRHTLHFVTAPMVHWPEVLVTYDSTDNVLFSADAFGKFGALDCDEEWDDEARRYYIGIVGKYGEQAQRLLKKAAAIYVEIICPLHGPVLSENLSHYIGLYKKWSGYEAETDGVAIFYTSVYGNTKKAVEFLERALYQKGCPAVRVYDLARCDAAEALAAAFRFGKSVFATTTYNSEIFPFMRNFLADLKEHNFQNRTVALIENGTWAPSAARAMKKTLEGLKNIKLTETTVSIHSAVSKQNEEMLLKLSEELCAK